jgi:ribosomal protein S12 methylthiotransferase
MRGDLVSRPIAEVLLEARRLLDAGVKELLVISQDTSAYGVDVRYRTGFVDGRPVRTRMTELVRELDRLARDHGAWVRLHYVYPYPHVDEVVELMADDASRGGLVAYLDVPFQHASPRILKLMKRPAAPERVLERVRMWRQARPDLAIRSTFIAGFPGETEAEFDELLAFLDAAELDRVGCFAYSPVDGAAANALPGAVDPDVREARRARFMEKQAAISERRLAAKVGRTIDAIVDGHETTGRGASRRTAALARSTADAPEIDGVVRIDDGAALAVGSIVRATVTSSDAHDLGARLSADAR